ncbi:MAG: terpene cyclase/mutase family protein [Gemmataceae bacterium]|nr:terpene cyclase/mutase family protein [Gemmataceae bacterium]
MTGRRKFLTRGLGSLIGLAGGGLVLRGLAQDNPENQARGMITAATQETIDSGLAYLERQQHEDGSWGTNQYTGNVAVTALCGLAFMAGGHQPGRGRYGRCVSRALQFVLAHEDRNTPGFLNNPRASLHGPMYGHGFATLFLAEAHGMVNEPQMRDQLRGTLDRAVKLLIKTQNTEGGWRYQPRPHDADISVTICQIMALRAARNAGFAVPKKVADNCIKYVKECQDLHGSGGFYYQRRVGQAGFARTAAGVVALYSAGLYEGEEVKKGLDFLMRFKPGDNRGGGLFGEHQIHYYYGHYYAAQAMWIAGPRYWREWYPAVRNELLSMRQGGQGEAWWFDGRFCRHYCTSMALIILQIPNNYLPILQR